MDIAPQKVHPLNKRITAELLTHCEDENDVIAVEKNPSYKPKVILAKQRLHFVLKVVLVWVKLHFVKKSLKFLKSPIFLRVLKTIHFFFLL